MKIIFFPVKTTTAKLNRIVSAASAHFHKGEPLLFFVQDETAWEFLDKLLWSHPAESFLPHPCKLIQIRHTFDPSISTVFNLSPTPLIQESIKTLYELEDHTAPEKLKASQERYDTYRSKELQIVVES